MALSSNQQIGWSQESRLLQTILKQVERLTGVISTISGGGGGGVTTLGALTDVSLTAPLPGDVLAYNGTHWVNVPSGAGGLTPPAGALNQVQYNAGGVFGADTGFVYDHLYTNIFMSTANGGSTTANTFILAGAGYINNTYVFGEGNKLTTAVSGSAIITDSFVTGWGNWLGDGASFFSGSNSFLLGSFNNAYGVSGFAGGYGSQAGAAGKGNFAIALNGTPSTDGSTRDNPNYKWVIANNGSFNISQNTAAQVVGHGALAVNSAILGGADHNIPADSNNSVIIGGSGIKARAASINQVYVPTLNINSVPVNDDAQDQVLVRDPLTGEVKYRTATSIGGTAFLSNAINSTQDGYFTGVNLLESVGSSFYLRILSGSDLTANRTFTIITGDGSRVLSLAGNLTTTGAFNTTLSVSGSNTITFPNAAITVARIDAAQTFTGVQTMTSPSITTGINTVSTSFNLINTIATSVNIAGAATNINIASNATATFSGTLFAAPTVGVKDVNIAGGGANGSSTTVDIGSSNPGATGTLRLNFGTISTSSNNNNISLWASTTTVAFAASVTTLSIQSTTTGGVTANYSCGPTTNAVTKTINIGTGGVAGSTTNVNIGSATLTAGTLSMNLATFTLAQAPATDVAFSTSSILTRTTTGVVNKVAPSGGGTANYLRADGTWAIPISSAAGATGNIQFNNAGALAGSNNLFWNNVSGRLGIGTATPVGTLQVTGGATDPAFVIKVPNQTIWSFLIFNDVYNAGSSSVNGLATNAGGFELTTAQHLALMPGGNVGIGTTAPQGRLNIVGAGATGWGSFNFGTNLIIDGTRNNAIGIFDNTGANPIAIASSSGGITIAKMPALNDSVTAPLNLLFINDLGNALIGRANINPTTYGAGTNTLSISGLTDSGFLDIYFAGIRKGLISSTASTFGFDTAGAVDLTLRVNNSEKMRILANGNVGIGRTDPTTKLGVQGSIRISDPGGSGYFLEVNNGYGGAFNPADDFSYIAKFNGDVTQVGAYTAMVITGGFGGGRVGIGTVNPLTTLDVNGSIGTSGGGTVSPPAGLGYGLFPFSSVGLGFMSANGGFGWWGGSGSATERMRLQANGTLRIHGLGGSGTTTATVDVNGVLGRSAATAGDPIITATGTNNYVFNVPDDFVLYDGFRRVIHFTNGNGVGPVTFNYNGTGVFNVVRADGTAVPNAYIKSNSVWLVMYLAGQWRLIGGN